MISMVKIQPWSIVIKLQDQRLHTVYIDDPTQPEEKQEDFLLFLCARSESLNLYTKSKETVYLRIVY